MTKTLKKKPSSTQNPNEEGVPSASPAAVHEERSFNRPVIHLLSVIFLGFLVYSNTFHGPFQWDEAEYIVSNPAVKELAYFMDPSGAPGMNLYSFRNRYVGYLTFALNYRLHGFDVVGYHVVNLAVHLINAILVYFLVLLTFRTPFFAAMGNGQRAKGERQKGTHKGIAPAHYSPFTIHGSRFFAFAVALLFVAHPLQTEAVTYVFQRFASLVSLFYLLSLVLYIKGRLRQASASRFFSAYTFACFFLSFISAVLAMKTKENAFTLPLVITLYEFLFFAGSFKSRALRLLPFLFTMLIIPITIIRIEGSLGEIVKPMAEPSALGHENLPRSEYFFTQIRVIVTYLRLLVFPAGQNLIHDYPVYRSFFTPEVLLSFLFLLSIFGTAVYLLHRSRREAIGNGQGESKDGIAQSSSPMTYRLSPIACYRLSAFGILWFFITLSVESSVIPLAMVINEYRVYLPSAGFFLAATAGGALLLQAFTQVSAKTAASAFLAIILLLALAAYSRNTLWKDKVLLWEDVARKNSSSPRVYNNLGIAYYEKGLYERAIDTYQRAVSLSPDNFLAHANVGVAYAVTGRTDTAIEHFIKSLDQNPNYAATYANLGHALRQRGRFAEAAGNYLRAVALNPFDGAAFYGLGSAYLTLGRLDDALAAYTRFVELSPRDPEAYRNRGMVYAKKGDRDKAAADFRDACALGSRESCERGYVR